MEKSLVNTPGVIAIMQYDDGRTLEYRMGVEDIHFNTPINSNSIFDIASVSKQFTAFCVLLLEERGLLKLNSLLAEYIPEAAIFNNDITIENLIYHTSGLPCLFDIAESKEIDYFSDFKKTDIIKGIFEKEHLSFIPGTKHEYSNTGYILLSQLIENVSGTSFADFVKREIFDPLEMKNSFVYNGLMQSELAVSGYQKKQDDFFSPVYSPWDVIGAGLIHSSANDLMKWGLNFSSASVGGDELIQKMLTPLPGFTDEGIMIEDHNPYCFGIELEEGALGRLYYHLGSTFGRESYFIRSQCQGFTLAVLSNIEDYDVSSVALKLYNQMNLKDI